MTAPIDLVGASARRRGRDGGLLVVMSMGIAVMMVVIAMLVVVMVAMIVIMR